MYESHCSFPTTRLYCACSSLSSSSSCSGVVVVVVAPGVTAGVAFNRLASFSMSVM